jgi:hypothetical protein
MQKPNDTTTITDTIAFVAFMHRFTVHHCDTSQRVPVEPEACNPKTKNNTTYLQRRELSGRERDGSVSHA